MPRSIRPPPPASGSRPGPSRPVGSNSALIRPQRPHRLLRRPGGLRHRPVDHAHRHLGHEPAAGARQPRKVGRPQRPAVRQPPPPATGRRTPPPAPRRRPGGRRAAPTSWSRPTARTPGGAAAGPGRTGRPRPPATARPPGGAGSAAPPRPPVPACRASPPAAGTGRTPTRSSPSAPRRHHPALGRHVADLQHRVPRRPHPRRRIPLCPTASTPPPWHPASRAAPPPGRPRPGPPRAATGVPARTRTVMSAASTATTPAGGRTGRPVHRRRVDDARGPLGAAALGHHRARPGGRRRPRTGPAGSHPHALRDRLQVAAPAARRQDLGGGWPCRRGRTPPAAGPGRRGRRGRTAAASGPASPARSRARPTAPRPPRSRSARSPRRRTRSMIPGSRASNSSSGWRLPSPAWNTFMTPRSWRSAMAYTSARTSTSRVRGTTVSCR